MDLDGSFGDAERPGDLLVGFAGREKVQNLPLARGQFGVMEAPPRSRLRGRSADRHRRHEHLASRGRPQRMLELQRRTALWNEAVASRSENFEDGISIAP